ncbi:hypothetical protein CC1G_06824 [Coprinopsis cinerea okayama7|uniref:DH domain-containing protein n=1 Tax=Coprinopsis cinerea (strain Okayama-7 / 130 / ATCC MYA-4618 / FGSC 9003) TaxID=240176 RepID=A8N6V2_COPC7|nr:hypothetical protein CC1G_06824 [Coprinopsis cinerea okayama7\|eukprot:XP_001830558.2 hypothetical protein CC1G_06824 [Coprinopsis cinerea okayama7\
MSSAVTVNVPCSDLVGASDPAAQTTPSSLSLSAQRAQVKPPAIPVRSPLRPPPPPKSRSSQSSSGTNSRSSRATLDTPPLSGIDHTLIVDPSTDGLGQMHDQDSDFPSLNDILNAVNAVSPDQDFPKSLAVRPDSPIVAPLDGRSRVPRKSESSGSSSLGPPQPSATAQPMTKRQHALHELLSSERAYASDLALIREVHIPLALGQTVPLQNLPISPPNSSASSSRTLSTASDSSTASLGPPMTQDDARIIFSNISELALFSDMFSEELEIALGALVEGGTGEDRVGELFLRIIPELERPYQYYITRHPTALQHLQGLPQTPALQAYLTYTQTVASSLSHAWDLASLLIKPVQRLLKYPLLLTAIIEETPDSHPDKQNLKDARTQMEEVARNVNEIRRRAEVVKDVLTSKKKSVNVTVAATVNLSKMKNLRPGSKGPHNEENGEAAQVERMSQELKRIELFAQQFAKNVVEWARSMSKVVGALRTWAVSFGRVIGLNADQGSEAFDAFLAVVEHQLMPLCVDLEAIINERLLKEIAHLLKTMNQPYKLLASMQEQEPFHWHLLNMNVSSKNRPPPALLAASTNYLALRGQLAQDLPTYLALLHQGMSISVRRLADIQTRFWKDVKDRWSELWEMLRVEGELNGGHEETINVWRSRWLDVDEVVSALNINQTKKIYQEPEHARPSTNNLHSMLSSLEPGHTPQKRSSGSRHTPNDPSISSSSASSYVSVPYPLQPGHRTRGRPSGEDSHRSRSLSRRSSNDSLFSKPRSSKGKSPRRKSDRDELVQAQNFYQPVPHPYAYNQHGGTAIPRRKSMPLPSDSFASRNYNATRRNTSPPRGEVYGIYEDDDVSYYASQIYHPYSAPVDPPPDSHHREARERERLGKISRNNSSKKATTTGMKESKESSKQKGTQNRQRSSSVTSFFKADRANRDAVQEPMPHDADMRHLSPGNRDSWVGKPAKYICRVIHPCKPPASVYYFSFPFFTLYDGDLYEVLQEAGHPSIHPKLPLYVDDGEDCLLLCRNGNGTVGWALASFLEPINLPT